MKMWRKFSFRNDSRRPLLDKKDNNNDIQDGFQQPGIVHELPVAPNTLRPQEEPPQQGEEPITPQITPQQLAELLGVAPDADTSKDGSCCSSHKLNDQQLRVRLIQRSVNQHFPKPPSDVEQNLHQYLVKVKEGVLAELLRLAPMLERLELMGCLIECYHCQTFNHLSDLLQNISSVKNSLVLNKWVLQTYLSREFLGHPDLQRTEPIEIIDLLLFSDVAAKANEKLIENVQKEARGNLEKILQLEEYGNGYDELYVDTIQCIAAMAKEAQNISPKLSDEVEGVCLCELLNFTKRFCCIFDSKIQVDHEMRYLFNTLRNSQQLRKFVLTKGESVTRNEVLRILGNIENDAMGLLMKRVADLSKSHLQKYFKSKNREYLLLLHAVKSLFSELPGYENTGIPQFVMGRAYRLIAHLYLKHLIQSSQSKLRRCWSPNVARQVAEDADLLHNHISDLVPGIRPWNLMLLKVTELLECDSIDMTKLTAASMQQEGDNWSEDLELLPEILQWKGLSKQEVRKVLFVLEDLPGYKPRPRPESCFFSFQWCW